MRCVCNHIIGSRVAQDNTVLFLSQHFLNLNGLTREHLFLTAPLTANRWLPAPPFEEGRRVFPPICPGCFLFSMVTCLPVTHSQVCVQKTELGCVYGQPGGDGHVLGPHSIGQNSGVKPA